jgi:hypothetical protein
VGVRSKRRRMRNRRYLGDGWMDLSVRIFGY